MTNNKNERIGADLSFLLKDEASVIDFKTASESEIREWMDSNLPKTLPDDRRDSILAGILALREEN